SRCRPFWRIASASTTAETDAHKQEDAMDVATLVTALGVDKARISRGELEAHSPVDGTRIAKLAPHSPDAVSAAIERAHEAFLALRMMPAPKRGELVRLFG